MKQRIKDKYSELSDREKQVAKYVVDHYQQSMLLSSNELARVSKVSDTAVIRFAKALGFKGFLEYKNCIKKEYISTQKVYSSLSLLDKDSDGKLLNIYMKNLMMDVQNFINDIDDAQLSKIVEAIEAARKVYLVGFGSDEVTVVYLKNYLKILGVDCISITEEGLALKENLFLLGGEDLILLFAYPTLSESEKWVCNYGKGKKSNIILITDSEITAKELGISDYVAFYETADNFFNSYVLQMAYCNALLLRMYEMYPEKMTQTMKAYHDMLNIMNKNIQ
ncbi:MAG: MurR/RpiR family transcriptional regulator [Filifactoraceae bacterium]